MEEKELKELKEKIDNMSIEELKKLALVTLRERAKKKIRNQRYYRKKADL